MPVQGRDANGNDLPLVPAPTDWGPRVLEAARPRRQPGGYSGRYTPSGDPWRGGASPEDWSTDEGDEVTPQEAARIADRISLHPKGRVER